MPDLSTSAVLKDAQALLAGYLTPSVRLGVTGLARAGKTVFVPVHWKLITLENLLVDLKFEFNQSNRGLYGADAAKSLLSEGEVK